MRDADLIELTVVQAAAALRERMCSCREYVEALIARCEAVVHLNALQWRTRNPAGGRSFRFMAGTGPLSGGAECGINSNSHMRTGVE